MALTTAQIQAAYVTFFNRPADVEGLNYWSSYAGSVADLYATFAGSKEYKDAFAGLSNSAQVNAVYNNLFGRDAEAEGLNYWVNLLANGSITLDGLALTVAAGAQTTDLATFENRKTAATAFTKELDTTAEILAYQGSSANVVAKQWLSSVKDTTASLEAAVAPSAIDAAVKSMTGATTGATYTLTTAIDNFTGTAGNDLFIGGNGAQNTTGPADQIDGGAGVDTFKYYGGVITGAVPTLKNVENLYLNSTSGTLNAASIAGLESVEIDTAAAAHTVNLSAAQSLTLSNINANAIATTVTGSSAKAITLNNVVDKTVAPNAAQALNINTRDTALALNAATAASNITLQSNSGTAAADMAALTKLTVTGDAKLTVAANAGYTALTTVDASASTGGVDFRQAFDTNLTFTGGTAADRVLVTGAITAQDKLDGGAGSDTLAIANGGLLAPAVANVKNFEVLEVRGGLTQDASVFAAQNTLTGLTVVNTTGVQAFNVTNLAATAKDGIIVNAGIAANTTALTTTVSGFLAGGTSDSATVTMNANSASSTGANASVLSLTFENADVLNLVSKGTLATNANTINLAATDLEKLVVSGNIATTVVANIGAVVSSGITEVDASGLVVTNGQTNGLTFTQAAGATQSLLVTGSNGLDTVAVTSAKGTVVANGGNDSISFSTAAVALGDQSVNLSAKDFVANTAQTVTFHNNSDGFAVINFSADIEALLKIGGANLATTTANQAVGAVINGQNNVALVGNVLQFDVNGDGRFDAASDYQITLTGVTAVTYDATNDFFVMTTIV